MRVYRFGMCGFHNLSIAQAMLPTVAREVAAFGFKTMFKDAIKSPVADKQTETDEMFQNAGEKK